MRRGDTARCGVWMDGLLRYGSFIARVMDRASHRSPGGSLSGETRSNDYFACNHRFAGHACGHCALGELSLAAPWLCIRRRTAQRSTHAPGIVLVGWKEGVLSSRNDDLLAQGSAKRRLGRARLVRAIGGVGVDVLRVERGLGSGLAGLPALRPASGFCGAGPSGRLGGFAVGYAGGRGLGGGAAGLSRLTTRPTPCSGAWPTLRMAEAWQRTPARPTRSSPSSTPAWPGHPDLADKLWTQQRRDRREWRWTTTKTARSTTSTAGTFTTTQSGDYYVPADDANIVRRSRAWHPCGRDRRGQQPTTGSASPASPGGPESWSCGSLDAVWHGLVLGCGGWRRLCRR